VTRNTGHRARGSSRARVASSIRSAGVYRGRAPADAGPRADAATPRSRPRWHPASTRPRARPAPAERPSRPPYGPPRHPACQPASAQVRAVTLKWHPSRECARSSSTTALLAHPAR
jgi:hypothetical protein